MDRSKNIGSLIAGSVLILLGVLSLLGRLFDLVGWGELWPLIVIAAGASFFVGMFFGGKSFGALAIPGSIVVTVGGILLVMNITGHWTAWSYAWALIISAVGAGLFINGLWSEQPELKKRGSETFRGGIALFLTLGIVIEFIFSIIGISNWGNLLYWAILVGIVGVVQLVSRLLRSDRTGTDALDLYGPIFLIGISLVAIMFYSGWAPRENLWRVVNLWPLLLIAAGLRLLFRRYSKWVSALIGILILAAILVTALIGDRLGLQPISFFPFEFGTVQFGDITGELVTGSGIVISEDREVRGFSSVSMGIPGELEIIPDDAESLTITGEDNILPLIVTEVTGEELSIHYKPGFKIRTGEKIKIRLTVRGLKVLENSSSGKIIVKPLTTSDFRLEVSSSGDVEVEEVNAERIIVEITSSGDVEMRGNVDELELTISSSGNFEGEDLEARRAIVRLTSSGDATVWVTEELDARLSSSGDLYYYGDAVVRQSTTSSGDVVSKGSK